IVKKGLLTYGEGFHSVNIGDYIQSIAARTFYDTVEIFLEREKLESYSNAGRIQIILNGWFMHSARNWPPSENIIPKITSFHISPNSAKTMLGEEGVRYFKDHAPIGCRDNSTKALLDSHNIPAYFSGCLTLTLGRKYKRAERNGKIYFVDVPLQRPGFWKILLWTPVIVSSWRKIMKIRAHMKMGARRAAVFYCVYRKMFADDLLTSCEFIKHSFVRKEFPDDKARFEFAEALIQKYAGAELVVTARLHAALPCLALETPCIFVHRDMQDERFAGLLELLRVVVFKNNDLKPADEILKNIKGKISRTTKIENKNGYIPIKQRLEKECAEFMENASGGAASEKQREHGIHERPFAETDMAALDAETPKPKVSIIVPVYNVEKYIAQCIDSIVSQTFTDFECILVDDCSPDRCPQICDEYARKDARIQVIHKRKNEGLPQARKTGFEAARGEYIQFVDGDDWIEAEMTERLYRKAVHGNFAIVYCDFVQVYENGSRVVRKHFDARGMEKQQIVAALLFGELPWSLCNKIFHRKLFHDLTFPIVNIAEDGVLCSQLFLNADKIGYEYSHLYNYRIHPKSIVGNLENRKRNAMRRRENIILLNAILKKRQDYDLYRENLSVLLKGNRYPLWKEMIIAIAPRKLLTSYCNWRRTI
ncbi:MAG: glycosyltransferase, partial [Zoogloeaceae bacterium]|nr:glycosyltransferase [Zoogloeaceae bacterium]